MWRSLRGSNPQLFSMNFGEILLGIERIWGEEVRETEKRRSRRLGKKLRRGIEVEGKGEKRGRRRRLDRLPKNRFNRFCCSAHSKCTEKEDWLCRLVTSWEHRLWDKLTAQSSRRRKAVQSVFGLAQPVFTKEKPVEWLAQSVYSTRIQ